MRTGHKGRRIRVVAVKVTLAAEFGESKAPDALGSDRGGERTEAILGPPAPPKTTLLPASERV